MRLAVPSLFRGITVFLALLALPLAAHAQDHTYFVAGDPQAATTAPTTPGLMLMGGSDDVDAAFRWFIAHAGGGHIVILRASGEDGYHDYLFKQLGGITSVETIRFHNRAASEDPRVLEIIARADGLFLAGGDQANYINFWRGTSVHRAIEAHVRKGRPLGGTSAGLAVLGHHAYGALDGGSLVADVALRDPYDPAVTLVSDFLKLPGMEHVITDSHFAARKRQGRLATWVTRLARDTGDTRLIGIGVDEKTALCVEPDGTARVFTGAQGQVWLFFPPTEVTALAAGKPLAMAGLSIVRLDPGSAFNVRTQVFSQPAGRDTASARDGVLTLTAAP